MDELTLFTELKPPPPDDLAGLVARARTQLDPVLGTPAGPTVTGSEPPAGAGPDSGRAIRRSVARSWATLGPRHRRRRLALGLAAVAVVACAATVVPSVLLGGHSTTLTTSAYAITRGTDGTVTVSIYTIASAADGAGLQRDLRAVGVPALVRVQQSTSRTTCQIPDRDFEPLKIQEAVVRTEFYGKLLAPEGAAADAFPAQLTPAQRASVQKNPSLRFIIHPAAMPSGSALYIWRQLYTGPGGHWLQEIGTPRVLNPGPLPC